MEGDVAGSFGDGGVLGYLSFCSSPAGDDVGPVASLGDGGGGGGGGGLGEDVMVVECDGEEDSGCNNSGREL